MAVKLVARMSLVDNFSKPMRNVGKELDRNQKALDKMRQKASLASKELDKAGRAGGKAGSGLGSLGKLAGGAIGGIGRLVSALNPLNAGFLGIASAAGAAYGAVKIFNSTVGEAMKMQQSQVMITSMFGDPKEAQKYMDMLDRMSIKSPIFDSQQMYGNSKSFVAISKDTDQLEKMWSLAERLTASDPAQGLEGAVFALRELFSGDDISLRRRFEMDGNVLDEIKRLPLDQQLAKMDEYMNKMGLTTKLINDMGGTALGMWSQVKERFQLVLRDMGEPSLKAVSTFLGGLLDRLEGEDMTKFAEWGGKVIENMVSGLSNNAIRLYDWFTALTSDPEFQSKTTVFGKVDFIVADIAAKFQAWYDGGGEDKILTFGSGITETLLGALNNSAAFSQLGAQLGSTFLDGVMAGIRSAAESSTLGKIALQVYQGTLPGAVSNAKKAWNEVGAPTLKKASKALKRNWANTGVSHSAGLDRVPYDGYQATLHKDEQILSPAEARENRDGGKGGVSIVIQNMSVREDSDIDKIALRLAQLIEGKEVALG